MRPTDYPYLGVDWDSGSWITVGVSDAGDTGCTTYPDFETLWDTHGTAADRIVVDIPIGLCQSRDQPAGCVESDGELSRQCDDLARTVLKHPRSSSVFTTPCREVAHEADTGTAYEALAQTNEERTGKGLMRQAANIAPGIAEVETVLLNGGDPDVVLEAHPEVCFRAFADEPLAYNKKTAPGMDERLTALETSTEYDRGTWRDLAASLATDGIQAGIDDLIDALALAVTATAPEDELQRLPEDPPKDVEGLPMQMVYRRPEPFELGYSARSKH